ncbi:MAG: COG1361 S-layer family protein [Candidatus Bathyarchaeia archaeon]
MRKRGLMIFSMCLLSLFITVTTPLTTAYPQPLLKIEVSGYHLTAGDENEIRISITNVGEADAYDVKAYLTVPQTVSGIAVVEESYRVFPVIEEDQTKRMYPTLYVASDCPLGAYSLTFTLGYVYGNVTYGDSLQIGVVVDAIKPMKLALDVDVDDYYVTAGTENEISITLTNTGDEAVYDVKAVLTSTSPGIVVLKRQSYLVDEVDVGEDFNFRPLLGISGNVALGAYPLTLTLDYKDSDGAAYRDSVTVGVFVNSVEPTDRTTIVIQEFQIIPSEVHPGDELTIKMKIKNLGGDAHDIRVQLITTALGPLVSLSPSLVFVGDLESNQAAVVTYNLRVSGDAEARSYPLQLSISYYDTYGQSNSISETLSVGVSSIINFRLLNVQPSSLTAEPGEIVAVEADLLLIGTEAVDFVQIEIVENRSINPFVSIPESYEYIGRVDPDSPVPFDVQFMVDPNATPGDYTLQMRVSCWDEYNREHQATIELPVVVEELIEERGELGLTFWDMIWRVIRILLGVRP